MLSLAVRRASLRTLASSSRRAAAVSRAGLSTSARVQSDHGPSEPIVVGKGSGPAEIPTNRTQATGYERLQLLGEMEGYDFFDMDPLYIDRLGTPKDPIIVKSYGVCHTRHRNSLI